ncbi:unnamed protein product [Cercospora beticola]|nr:unnamed protein product [Cercospora beticola]
MKPFEKREPAQYCEEVRWHGCFLASVFVSSETCATTNAAPSHPQSVPGGSVDPILSGMATLPCIRIKGSRLLRRSAHHPATQPDSCKAYGRTRDVSTMLHWARLKVNCCIIQMSASRGRSTASHPHLTLTLILIARVCDWSSGTRTPRAEFVFSHVRRRNGSPDAAAQAAARE